MFTFGMTIVSARSELLAGDVDRTLGEQHFTAFHLDKVVSSNRKPDLLKIDAPGGVKGKTIPVFSSDFDFDEALSIRREWVSLSKVANTSLWEKMLLNSADNRYSITFRLTELQDTPRNRTVGDLCAQIARNQLLGVAKCHPAMDSRGLPAVIDLGIHDLVEWRKQRPEKELHELQVVVCDIALERLDDLKTVTDKTREDMRRTLVSVREKIKLQKRPHRIPFPWDSLGHYTRDDAERFRRLAESATKST